MSSVELTSAALVVSKNTHSPSSLHRPTSALGFCRERTQIRRQACHNSFKKRTQISLPICGSSSSLLSLNEFVRGVRIPWGAPRASAAEEMDSRTPVLLFDVMGTIVRDPFYQDIPAFFGVSLKELLQIKHPTAWIEFEKGLISEEELVANFFKDKRSFDSDGLKTCVANGYAYLEGVEALLDRLKTKGYQMHAFTNYPSWYELIEEKLELSKYLNWTFVSCQTGKRKPDPEAFLDAAKQLALSPSDIIFIDDQVINVEAAIQTGMTGITFQGAEKLENELLTLGVML